MRSQQETSIVIPSVVGIGKIDFGLLSAGNLRRGTREYPHTVHWNETQFLVGEHVGKFARPSERMDFLRLAEGPELRALIYATLAGLSEPTHYLSTSLMVGLPVEVMMNRPLATQLLRELRGWLAGAHQFTVDDKPYQINIENIQAAAQPAGSYFAWGMNDQGKWGRTLDDLDALVAIGDIGYNTLDAFAVASGQIAGKFIGGNTAGIRRAAEALMREVKDRYDIQLSRNEADQYLRSEKPVLACWQGDIEIANLTEQALEATAAGIGDFLETLWGNAKQFRYLIFTGGGTEMLKRFITRRYPHGQILGSPVMANALGLARYGRRIFKDASTVVGLDPGFGGFKAVLLDHDGTETA